ncbi:MAG: SDR family oxidoreductase [Acidobacteriota bacterium]
MKGSEHPRCAVVTGASGGLGVEICRELLDREVRVLALTARSESSQELREKLREYASQLETYAVDFRELDAIEPLVNVVEVFSGGALNLLINNAGVGYHCRIGEIKPEELNETFLVNVMAPILLTSRLLSYLQTAPNGHVINVTSILVDTVMPFTATYTASKRAIEGFFQVLRRECGVRVTSIEPGAIDTPFLKNTTDPPVREHFLGRNIKRLDPKEVARWIVRASETEGGVMPGRIQLLPSDQVL